jgi:hypothetical protein
MRHDNLGGLLLGIFRILAKDPSLYCQTRSYRRSFNVTKFVKLFNYGIGRCKRGIFTSMNHLNRLFNFNSSRYRLRQENAAFAALVPKGALVLDAGSGDAPYKSLFEHAIYESVDFLQVSRIITRHPLMFAIYRIFRSRTVGSISLSSIKLWSIFQSVSWYLLNCIESSNQVGK